MKVEVLINSLGGGGAERQSAWLASRLTERILSLEQDDVYPISIPIRHLSGIRAGASRLRKLITLPVQLWRLVRMTGKHTVVSFLTRANVLNVLAAAITGARAVISERQALREGPGWGMTARIRAKLLGIAYRQADLLIVNARGTADDLRKGCSIPRDRIKVVYNMCDVDEVCALAQEEVVVPERYVVASGRLAPQKGYDLLLRAWQLAMPNLSGTKLLILGNGPLEQALRDMAEKLGIAHSVIFGGFKRNPFPYLARAQALVMSSRYEGFPNVILEALALGTPVVSVDCNHGPREILSPESDYRARAKGIEDATYGVLVGSDDAPQLAAGIARAIMRSNELKQAGPVRARDFAPDRILEDWRFALDL